KDFGVDRGDASLAYSATMIGFALGNFLLGRFVDRFGIYLALMVAAIAQSAGFALASMSHNFWVFALLQGTLIGGSTAVTFGPLIADVSHWFHRRRGGAIAAIASGNYLAGTIWPLLLNGVLADQGWRQAYFVIAVVMILVMVPLSFGLRTRPPHQTGSANPQSSITRQIDLSPRAMTILLGIAGVGCCVAMSMPQVHIVALAADLGYGVAAGARMLSLMLAGGIVSRILSGLLADKIGGVKTLLLGSVLQCLALFLYIPFDGLIWLYAVSLIFGLAQGGIVPSYAMIIREYLPANVAGSRVGLVIMATVLGMAFGGWLSGWIFDQTSSYQAAFINGIAWNFLNIAIMLGILWKTGPKLKQPAFT
ncbi:MAG TPA: MFS transporter, partial [Rhizobiales bacterium]|nr:MFS transporter [Hyphomicrobiales bacterium]